MLEHDDHPLADRDRGALAVDEAPPGRGAVLGARPARCAPSPPPAASSATATHEHGGEAAAVRPAMHTRRDQGNEDREGACRTGRRRRSSRRCRCRARAARSAAPGSAARSSELAATPPTTRDRSARRRSAAASRPLDERPHDRPLVATRRGRPGARSSLARRGRAPRRAARSSARRTRSRARRSRATGNENASGSPVAREPVDRRAARVAEPEQPRALVERLAGGVVERRAEHAVAARGRARRAAACARRSRAGRGTAARPGRARGRATRRGRGGGRPATSGSPRAQASAFAAERPTSSAPIEPGPCVTATARRRRGVAPASPSASRTTGRRPARGGAATRSRARRRRSARAARPARRRRSRGSRRRRSTSAAAVSSQDVSIPRISRRLGLLALCRRPRDRVAPHDQRVLAVVRVVAAPDAAGDEAEPLVEPDRALVRDAHLERVAAALVRRGHLEEPLEQRPRDPAAAVLGVDGDVHHVPRVDVARDDRGSRPARRLASNAPRRERASAWRARRRTSSATTASGTSSRSICSIAPRSRSSSRRSSITRHASCLDGVRDADVERLDELGRAEVARERGVEARARQVALARRPAAPRAPAARAASR